MRNHILISLGLGLLLAGCGPTAIASRAAPVQAKANLRIVRLGLINYWEVHGTLPTSGNEDSWRVAACRFMDGSEDKMSMHLAIPTTCSHTTTDQTNVFLVEPDAADDSKTWAEFERRNPHRPLLVVFHDGCEEWKRPGFLRLDAAGRLTRTDGESLPAGKVIVKYVDDGVADFDSVEQAFSGRAATDRN